MLCGPVHVSFGFGVVGRTSWRSDAIDWAWLSRSEGKAGAMRESKLRSGVRWKSLKGKAVDHGFWTTNTRSLMRALYWLALPPVHLKAIEFTFTFRCTTSTAVRGTATLVVGGDSQQQRTNICYTSAAVGAELAPIDVPKVSEVPAHLIRIRSSSTFSYLRRYAFCCPQLSVEFQTEVWSASAGFSPANHVVCRIEFLSPHYGIFFMSRMPY